MTLREALKLAMKNWAEGTDDRCGCHPSNVMGEADDWQACVTALASDTLAQISKDVAEK